MKTPFPLIAVTRRRLLGSALVGAGLAPLAQLSLCAGPSPAAPRFVFVLLRGGMDGLYAVPAPGDPHFAPARGVLARYARPTLPLTGPFALHPDLPQLHAMYGREELAVVHAVGMPYRGRSHFDAQNLLETGGDKPFALASGWLARATGEQRAIAMTTVTPLLLRGATQVDTWAPSVLPAPDADLLARLEALYGADAPLREALARAKALRLDEGMPTASAMHANASGMGGMHAAASAGTLATLAHRAAEFLSLANGPRIAVLEQGGWDSHGKQNDPAGPIAGQMGELDAALGALREGLVTGGAWRHTVVVVATEFGREVAVNGTHGTDHGTGTAAFVLGGAVKGGRVLADWPGLGPRDRHEGRDLRVTTDLRAVLKGVLGDHLRIARGRLDHEVFPGSAAVRPLELLA